MSLEISVLANAYQQQKITPVEMVKEVYRRIASYGQAPVWTYLVPEAEAIAAANDLADRDRADLPLYGIPFSVKDNLHVSGMPTSAGCAAFAHYPEETATVVKKMLDAGALLIGKNTMDQFATGLVGTRSDPHPVNAFNAAYIPGGSSSGSAVAVAAGLVSFALASDTGGSGRVPAALNNIVGLKPTPGIISSHGMVYANRSFDCVPIFALTCADAKLVFDSAVGWDEQDPFMRDDSENIRRHRFPKEKFTVGVPHPEQLAFFGDDCAAQAFEQALLAVAAIGGKIERIDFEPFLAAGDKLFNGPFLAERLATVENFLENQVSAINPVVAQVIASAKKYSALDYVKDCYHLQEIRRVVAGELSRIDALMVPTTGTIFTIEEVEQNPYVCNSNMGYYTYFSNLLQLSALAVPASIRADGLPFGVCFLANAMEDLALLDLGFRWQQHLNLPLGAPVASEWKTPKNS